MLPETPDNLNNDNEKIFSDAPSPVTENNNVTENVTLSPQKPPLRIITAAALIVVGVALIGFWAKTNLTAAPVTAPAVSSSQQVSEPSSAPSAPSSSEPSSNPEPESKREEITRYPTDKFFVTAERLGFKEGDLVLRVPRLKLETTVVGEIAKADSQKFLAGEMTSEERASFLRNDNSADLLSQGVMLFNLSPLPGRNNANVSISGHRDICGKEFYYIDTITKEDKIYLDYLDETFCYEYVETTIVEADDWSPIYCKDFSCVTLISCDPIGTHRNRIVVTAKLVDIKPREKDKAPENSGLMSL